MFDQSWLTPDVLDTAKRFTHTGEVARCPRVPSLASGD